MTPFGPIRQAALTYWAEQTGRTILNIQGAYLLTDTFEGAYECCWQNGYPHGHVNLFCSLGDWACNLTDLLKDNRVDDLDLDDEESAIVIFRYYTRIMLVIAELLTDFQDIYLHAENLSIRGNSALARSFYFSNENPDRITKVLNYINSACKHKTQHIHLCNNHLPIIFVDSSLRRKTLNYFSILNATATKKDAVLVPGLGYLTKTVVLCYRRLNNYFRQHKNNYNTLCQTYS